MLRFHNPFPVGCLLKTNYRAPLHKPRSAHFRARNHRVRNGRWVNMSITRIINTTSKCISSCTNVIKTYPRFFLHSPTDANSVFLLVISDTQPNEYVCGKMNDKIYLLILKKSGFAHLKPCLVYPVVVMLY